MFNANYKIQIEEKIKEAKTFIIVGFFLSLSLFLTVVPAKADVVTEWNEIAETVIVSNAKRPAGAALVDMACVHAAIYDAVNAIDGRYSVYSVQIPNAPTEASKEAAAMTAAYHVLKKLFPAQQEYLETKYQESLSKVSEGKSKTDGISIGETVANRFTKSRAHDNRDANVPYIPKIKQGSGWQPTFPTYAAPLTPWLARMRPFMIESPWQFRPLGPPSLSSQKWAKDFNETKAFGDLNSKVRTPEQTEIGLFYTEHAGSQLSRIFRDFAATQKISLVDNARLFAMLYLSVADSLIAAWDSKYHFNYWRPVTAIRNADSDGNRLTETNSEWVPLAPTPDHPEYPAAHGSITAAYVEVLRHFFKTKNINIALTSSVTGTSRKFRNTDDLIREIINARVYGGMHYRKSGEDGVLIGKKVAHWMAEHYFQPVR